MAGYVYPTSVCVVGWQGGKLRLNPNDPWHDDHPFVKANPDFFQADPGRAVTSPEPPVERATRAPGERRTTRRPEK
jgi:hypothetical protein